LFLLRLSRLLLLIQWLQQGQSIPLLLERQLRLSNQTHLPQLNQSNL
jgi:hypothetical protein